MTGSSFGYLKVGCAGPRAGAVKLHMRGDRHVEVERGRPEPVVLRCRVAFAVGQAAEQDAFQAKLLAVLHLGDGVFDVGDRHDAHADQAVGGDRAIFLGEPVVVATDDGFVDLVMGDVAPENRAGDHGGEQDLGVEPVLVLLAHALLRTAGAGGVLDLDAEGLPGARGVAGAEIEEVGFQQRLALDHQRVAAVGQVDGVRGSVAVFRRDTVGPALGRDFQVPVGGDEGVRAGHGWPPSWCCGEFSAAVEKREAAGRQAAMALNRDHRSAHRS